MALRTLKDSVYPFILLGKWKLWVDAHSNSSTLGVLSRILSESDDRMKILLDAENDLKIAYTAYMAGTLAFETFVEVYLILDTLFRSFNQVPEIVETCGSQIRLIVDSSRYSRKQALVLLQSLDSSTSSVSACRKILGVAFDAVFDEILLQRNLKSCAVRNIYDLVSLLQDKHITSETFVGCLGEHMSVVENTIWTLLSESQKKEYNSLPFPRKCWNVYKYKENIKISDMEMDTKLQFSLSDYLKNIQYKPEWKVRMYTSGVAQFLVQSKYSYLPNFMFSPTGCDWYELDVASYRTDLELDVFSVDFYTKENDKSSCVKVKITHPWVLVNKTFYERLPTPEALRILDKIETGTTNLIKLEHSFKPVSLTRTSDIFVFLEQNFALSKCRVWIGPAGAMEKMTISAMEVLKDGGTTTIKLESGDIIHYPSPITCTHGPYWIRNGEKLILTYANLKMCTKLGFSGQALNRIVLN